AIININDVNAYRFLVVKVKANDNFYTSIKAIEQKWKSIVPDAPFDYSFVDQQFADMYRTDIQLQKAFSVASVLNLLIIFLGLSGIVSYSLTRRKKEIAVRRVLGANVLQVLYLFLKEYSLLLLIGNVIAWPLAYLFVHNWLQGFSYKVNSSIVDYVLVGVGVCFLTCLLIVLESYRSLKANPVNDLRNE
ncbi:MAG: hypothetical protein DI598_03845, partial [Pseudopedobacter saltans]